MGDVNPLQVGGVVLGYAEQVQIIALLIIADLKPSRTAGFSKGFSEVLAGSREGEPWFPTTPGSNPWKNSVRGKCANLLKQQGVNTTPRL